MTHVSVITGTDSGRYPDGNALLVRGSSETILIDPSLTIASAATAPRADRILISHCHEDHLAGLFRYPDAPVHVHIDDALGLESLDGLMSIYGMTPSAAAAWRKEVVERFHYQPRPDAHSFADGAVFDLGGVSVRAIHLPGHTRGHTGFFIQPDGVMFLADVDLTGFGPYYGDAWSSLDAFEQTLTRCREIDARTYVTFHHKGIIEGRVAFLQALADYEAMIGKRERALLTFLSQPHTLEEIVAHRFIYRPQVTLIFVEAVERRSAQLHLARLITAGAVKELDTGLYVRTAHVRESTDARR